MKMPLPRSASAAFTLIELTISAALMALILTSAYVCLTAGAASQKLVEARAEVVQTARVALALMSADLRCACPLSKDLVFVGMHRMLGDMAADNIDFATHNYTPRRPREGDFCQISYFIEKDPRSGKFSLWRRRNPLIAIDPLAGGGREEIAEGLRGLRFEYYDGYDWYDTWGEPEERVRAQSSLRDAGNVDGMPEAVRITLLLDASPRPVRVGSADNPTNEPPAVFQTVARLNLVALAPGGSAGSLSTNAAPGSPSQGPPGALNPGGPPR